LRTQDYVSNRRLLIGLADAVGRILLSYKEITILSGYTSRVSDMLEVFEDVQQAHYKKTTITSVNQKQKNLIEENGVLINSDIIKFEGVPVTTPNGDVLIEKLTFEVQSGAHVLITGPNGCGKSSLFRILGGLWPLKGGRLYKPVNTKIFYIPQRPYLSLGTLRDQVIYPHTKEDIERADVTDADLGRLLDSVQLLYIVDREGGWDAINDWKGVLSGGEKQKMAMARLFYHKPQYAILDECTSAVALDVEGKLYTKATEMGITLITVSHRPSLWQYHKYILQFDGTGNWKFDTLNYQQRITLEEEKTKLSKRLEEIKHLIGD